MSPLEKKFTLLWVHAIKGSTEVVVEHKFHPSRKWKFDFAHVTTKVAIEIEGGTGWRMKGKAKGARGRHVSPEGFAEDCEKYNAATALGWKVFRLTAAMVNATELEKISAFIKQQPILN